MGRGSVQLARVFGVPIRAHFGWFLVLLPSVYLAHRHLARQTAAPGDVVFVAAVGEVMLVLLVSVVVHEAGHALVARRQELGVLGIDLFVLGGLVRVSSAARSPGAELRFAAAGPLGTLLVLLFATATGVALGGADELADAVTLDGRGDLSLGTTMAGDVAAFNAVFLAFNLIPAYPLDGGRIAQAALWRATGNRHRATRMAAVAGLAFGAALVLGGVLLAGLTSQHFAGIGLAAVGRWIAASARSSGRRAAALQNLAGLTVADIMLPELMAIPADESILRAYEDFFARHEGSWMFPVSNVGGAYIGCVWVGDVERAAHGPSRERPVRDLIDLDDGRIGPQTAVEDLWTSSGPLRRGLPVIVVDHTGRQRGYVTADRLNEALRETGAVK